MRWSEGNDFRFVEFLKRVDCGGGGGLSSASKLLSGPQSHLSAHSPLLISFHSIQIHYLKHTKLFLKTFGQVVPWLLEHFSYSWSEWLLFILPQGLLSPVPEPSYILSPPSQHSEQLWTPWCGGCVFSLLSQDSDWPRRGAFHVWRMNEEIYVQSEAYTGSIMTMHRSEPLAHYRSAWKLGWWPIPLTSSSIVSVPVQNTGKVMESSKEPGHFGQFTWQNILRTVTTDQHWGISLTPESEWGHARWKNPTSHQGSHCRNVTCCATRPSGRGCRAASRARSPPEGRKSLCPHLEPVRAVWLAKHISTLL